MTKKHKKKKTAKPVLNESARAIRIRPRDISGLSAYAGAYKGASRSRDAAIGWSRIEGSADTAILDDLPYLRDRSSDLVRNNPIAAGSNHTKTTEVIGSGLRLNSTIDRDFLGLSEDQAAQFEETAERQFAMWAASENADIERTLSFPEQQELAFRSVLERGDHFVLLTDAQYPQWPFRLALQHIDAGRVSNENDAQDTETLIAGVRKSSAGAPVAYQVSDYLPGDALKIKRNWRTVPAFSERTGRRLTLHLYNKLRTGQTRGVPDLATVTELLKNLDRYTDSELDAALKASLFSLLVKTEFGDGLDGLNINSWDTQRREFYKGFPTAIKEGSSSVLELFPNDDVSTFDPNRPNTAFESFVDSLFAQVGVALQIPKEVLLKQFNSSYSASRAALLQLSHFVGRARAWVAMKFCQPVYEAWLYESVAFGRIAAPGFLQDQFVRSAYCGSEWMGDTPGHIDEEKAVKSAILRVQAGFSTRKRETSALTGESWEKQQRQREKEESIAGPISTSTATDRNNGASGNAMTTDIDDEVDNERERANG